MTGEELLTVQAEAIVLDMMVFSLSELTESGLEIYNRAVALQIAHMRELGAIKSDVASQGMNGVTYSFNVAGAGQANISPFVRPLLAGAGLCAR
ncbi:MAG: hypothetical protein FWF99_00085 [Desulfovibrionaceae bacterium]|nr:hypothetical protein [Desulfovibrionaceae bacterium]